MTCEPIRLGAVGLGRGFALTAKALHRHPDIHVVAAATSSATAGAAFKRDFGGTVYDGLDRLLADDRVEMVYVATPHELHRDHALACFAAGKHVVVEKPMAVTTESAATMVQAARDAGLLLLVGPSHGYDAPVALAVDIIASGQVGAVRMIHSLNCTDFLYRPRRPAELDTRQGGGVIFSQGSHQIDVVLRLLQTPPESVYAHTGNWDPNRPSEGAYSAMIRGPGAVANLTYSGYGHFDSDIWMGGIGELGTAKTAAYGAARRALQKGEDETASKRSRGFAGLETTPQPDHHEHFGPVVVFCEHGDLRLTETGVILYGNDRMERFECPFDYPRQTFVQALVDALRHDNPPAQTGSRGLAVVEICQAILDSAQSGGPIALRHQTGDIP